MVLKMRMTLRLFLMGAMAWVSVATGVAADAISGKYLLAFHACNVQVADCNNFNNHVTYLGQSSDGTNWTAVPGYPSQRGSVPDVVRRGRKLYIYNPGSVRRFDLDSGIWEPPVTVTIKTSDGSPELFVDPSLIVDESGSIVIFYMLGQIGSDPATCGGLSSCTKVFHSATEVSGSDGARFTVDPGARANIQISGNQTASDPDIFAGASGYVLYISKGQSIQVLTSPTLKGTYTDVPGLPGGMLTSGTSGGIPSGHYDSVSGKYWTYVARSQVGGVEVIRQAIHDRIDTPLADSAFNTTLSGSSFPGLGASYSVGSPGFAVYDTSLAVPGTVSVSTGWNLLGNSTVTSFSVAANLGDATKVNSVWKWLASSAKWAFYAPSLTGQELTEYVVGHGYETLTQVNAGEGFWIDAKVPFTGSLPLGATVTDASFQGLPPGWHLLSTGDTKTPGAFNTNVPVTSLWAWDNGLSRWYFYAPALQAQGGSALSDYLTANGYLDFASANKALGAGVGFWVKRP